MKNDILIITSLAFYGWSAIEQENKKTEWQRIAIDHQYHMVHSIVFLLMTSSTQSERKPNRKLETDGRMYGRVSLSVVNSTAPVSQWRGEGKKSCAYCFPSEEQGRREGGGVCFVYS